MATMHPKQPFLSDIQEIRKRARQHMDKGAVPDGYQLDLQTVLRVLNEALATEIVCVLRYKRHQFMARGLNAQSVSDEFAEHAAEEQTHADAIAGRITQLGGEPNFSPEGLATRSHSEYVEGDTLVDMIKEDLVAERIAVDSYSEIIRFFGDKDPTSRRLMEEILSKEEEHAEDMLTLIDQLGKK
ncbi:MAG TPA: ferritin-like domain-containing protein [Bryobacteraceae bacterium]|jgi:bacterioferritin